MFAISSSLSLTHVAAATRRRQAQRPRQCRRAAGSIRAAGCGDDSPRDTSRRECRCARSLTASDLRSFGPSAPAPPPHSTSLTARRSRSAAPLARRAAPRSLEQPCERLRQPPRQRATCRPTVGPALAVPALPGFWTAPRQCTPRLSSRSPRRQRLRLTMIDCLQAA